jgi:hypothetical protein
MKRRCPDRKRCAAGRSDAALAGLKLMRSKLNSATVWGTARGAPSPPARATTIRGHAAAALLSCPRLVGGGQPSASPGGIGTAVTAMMNRRNAVVLVREERGAGAGRTLRPLPPLADPCHREV